MESNRKMGSFYPRLTNENHQPKVKGRRTNYGENARQLNMIWLTCTGLVRKTPGKLFTGGILIWSIIETLKLNLLHGK